jgi:hypothetical protein
MKGLPESNLKGIVLPKPTESSTINLVIAAGDIRKLPQSIGDSEIGLGLVVKREVITVRHEESLHVVTLIFMFNDITDGLY